MMPARYSLRVHLGGPWKWKVWDHLEDEAVSFHAERDEAAEALDALTQPNPKD